MEAEMIMIVLVTFMVVGVPVLGLTARFALKPIVESIVRLREAFLQTPESAGSGAHVRRLEEEVSELREQVRRLADAAEFDRKLLESDAVESPGGSGGSSTPEAGA